MRVGILGSGLMGAKLRTLFARAGHQVVFSYARDADALLLAVHWSRMDEVLNQARDVSGKAIVSCSLPMNADDTELVVAHTSSGTEELARRIPGAQVVSAFNTVASEVLFSVFEARGNAPRPSLVYCGDDQRAKDVAAGLIRDVGFDPVDAGPLRIARTPSRSRCSSHDSPTRERAARSWRTGSKGSGSRHEAGSRGPRDRSTTTTAT
jgi:predicted dinucleotide-binding enzyme